MSFETFILLTVAIALGVYIGTHLKTRRNPASYPIFSEQEIDEATKKSVLYGKKLGRAFDKEMKLVADINKDNGGSAKKPLPQWVHDDSIKRYKNALMEKIEFELAYRAYKNQYFFMLEANKATVKTNKDAEKIRAEFMRGEWMDVLDSEGFDLGGLLRGGGLRAEADKRFEEAIKNAKI